ncbi:MAG: CPBP family intramembrane metalloprotease [Dysgonamonadaceae bacterium]|nr:CPBP family intramembrane metalloprotease [Dysgonamonadaceae bacterium]MDD4729088.1 CPBP family intramembrane metalloprotease [Dysgonamonadaceae bacterium]
MKAFENSSTQSKIIYLFIFCLAGLFLAGTMVSFINSISDGQLMDSAWGLRISSAIQMILMFFMPAITLIIWNDDNLLDFLGVNNFNTLNITFYLSIIAFVILIVLMPFISLLTQLNQLLILPDWLSGLEKWMQELETSAQETTNLLLSGVSLLDYLGNIIFIGLFAAIAEEVFFRGVLQQLLEKLFKNKHIGVWITAFIFSLMHLQFYGFLPRLILGVLLGYLFLLSHNLWIPIIIHFLNNALVVTLNFFFQDNSIYQSLENLEITPIFIASGLLSLVLTVYLLKIYQSKVTVNKLIQ